MLQGVALTGYNTTGPPAIIRLEVAWRRCLACAGEAASSLPWSVTDDDDRRQRAKRYWSPYTMCRWPISNNNNNIIWLIIVKNALICYIEWL